MKFSVIVCTYKRLAAIKQLLASFECQSLYPDEILIIDGSPDSDTENYFQSTSYKGLTYFKVKPEDRGLTRQRNFGVSVMSESSEVVCFLDDDTVLEPDYFEQILKVFSENDDVSGVGGIAINENRWEKKQPEKTYNSNNYYAFDGYVCKEGLRNRVRNYLKLASDQAPNVMPTYSHGRTMGYPITGKFYEVDLLVGMSMAFKAHVVKSIQFSSYFEGYGLYEDADFSIRALAFGKNVMATGAKLNHYHDAAGRPNKYKYGKMVTRNGWYVWRLKYKEPSLKARFKWNAISWVLIAIRATNIINTSKRKEALTEVAGRIAGWVSLLFNKPKVRY